MGARILLGGLHARRGKALSRVTFWAEARQEMQAALALAPPSAKVRRAELLIDMAQASHWLSDGQGTRRYAGEALSLVEGEGREDLEIAARSNLVFADASDGELHAGLDRYRQAVLRAGDRYPAAVAPGMEMASIMLYWQADFENAIRYAQEAIAMSRAAYDIATLARAQGDLGCALMGSGRYTEALQVFEEVRQESAKQGALYWQARSTSMQGGLHLDLFDFNVAAVVGRGGARDQSLHELDERPGERGNRPVAVPHPAW